MLGNISMVIVPVSDMSKSVAFYRDILGLPLKFQSPDWSEFFIEGTGLALHPESDLLKIQPGGISFGFRVNSIDEVFRELRTKGVRFVVPPKTQDFGAKLAVFLDPDGHSISLSDYQSAK